MQRTSSLPILTLWDRVLVTLQGEITDDMAAGLREEVLALIHASGAEGLVLDITGVWLIDSHLCSVLSGLANAAKLMGTPTIIAGMTPDSAQTLQAMGIELAVLRTALTTEQALEMLGVRATVRPRREWRDALERRRRRHGDDQHDREHEHEPGRPGDRLRDRLGRRNAAR